MEVTKESIEAFFMFREAEVKQSVTRLDEKLGWVFYPCQNAIKEAIEKSMA